MKKRRKQKKKTSEVLWKHAKRRAWQRFGLLLHRDDHRDLVKSIQSGEAKLIGRQSLAKSIWRVRCQEKEMVAVYDENRKAIVTFLKEDMVSSNVDWTLGHTLGGCARNPIESLGEAASLQ